MDVNEELKQMMFGDLSSQKETAEESDDEAGAVEGDVDEKQPESEDNTKSEIISDFDEPGSTTEEQRQKLFEDLSSGKITADEFNAKADAVAYLPVTEQTETEVETENIPDLVESNNEEQVQKTEDNRSDAILDKPYEGKEQTVARSPGRKRKKILAVLASVFILSAVFFSVNYILRIKNSLFAPQITEEAEQYDASDADNVSRRTKPAVMSDYDFLMLCGKGSLQRILYAVKNGANVNAKGNKGITPLMFAVMNNPDREVIKALIDAGADVNAKDDDGMAPLMFAARFSSNPEILTTLIEAGADANAKDADGMTPLIAAAACNLNHEMLTTLIKKEASIMLFGTDTKAKDKFGNMAIDYARKRASIRNTDVFWKINDLSY